MFCSNPNTPLFKSIEKTYGWDAAMSLTTFFETDKFKQWLDTDFEIKNSIIYNKKGDYFSLERYLRSAGIYKKPEETELQIAITELGKMGVSTKFTTYQSTNQARNASHAINTRLNKIGIKAYVTDSYNGNGVYVKYKGKILTFDSEDQQIKNVKRIDYTEKTVETPTKEINTEPVNEGYMPYGFKDSMTELLNKMKVKFGIAWEYDYNLTTMGRFKNGKVYINPNKATEETVFHEFLHPFVNVLKAKNTILYNTLISEFKKDTKLVEFVTEQYSDVSIQEQEEEGVVAFLANKMTDSNQTPSSLLQRVIDRILEYLGINTKYTVQDLANLNLDKLFDILLDSRRLSTISPEYVREEFKLGKSIYPGEFAPLSLQAAKEIANRVDESYPWLFTDLIKYDDAGNVKYTIDVNYKSNYKRDSRANFSNTFEDVTNPNNWRKDGDFYVKDGSNKKLTSVNKEINRMSENKEVRNLTSEEAEDYYLDKEISKRFGEGEFVSHKGMLLNKESYKQERKKERLEARNNGKIIDSTIQFFVERFVQGDYTEESRINFINSLVTEYNRLDVIYIVDKLTSIFKEQDTDELKGEEIKKYIRSNPLIDTVSNQVVVANEELDMAGTMDIFAEHAKNIYSIGDIKNGNSFLKDFPFAAFIEGETSIQLTPIEKANLQVALYAFLVKSVNKDAEFYSLYISHISRDGILTKFNVDMSKYLPLIEKHLIRNGKQDFVNKNKSLFNASNYYTSYNADIVSGELRDTYNQMEVSGKEEVMREYFSRMRAKRPIKSKMSDKAREELINVGLELIKLRTGRNITEFTETGDIGWYEKYFSRGIVDPRNSELLKSLSDLYYQSFTTYKGETTTLSNKHNELLKAVIKESDGTIADNFLDLFRTNPMKHIGFMWINKNDEWRFIEETDSEFNSQVNTQAKKEYYKFFKNTLIDYQKKAIKYDENQINNWRLKAINDRNPAFDPTKLFTWRIPKDKTVINTLRNGRFKEGLINFLGTYNTDDTIDFGVPVKYLGSQQIIANEEFSFDTEAIFNLVLNQLSYKAEMDETYDLFQIAKLNLEFSENKDNYKNTIDFIDSMSNILIMKKTKKLWTRELSVRHIKGEDGYLKKAYFTTSKTSSGQTLTKKILTFNTSIPNDKATEEMLKYEKITNLEIDKVFGWLRNLTGAVFIAFKPFTFVTNLLTEASMNFWEGSKGSTFALMAKNKWFGLTDEDLEFVGFTTGDLSKANVEYLKEVKKNMQGKPSKLYSLMKKFNLSPDFDLDNQQRRRALDKRFRLADWAYANIKVGEEYNAGITLIAQMIKDGMWDKYNDNGDYIGEARGVIKEKGKLVELKEYTSREIRRLEDKQARLHGAYNKNQRYYVDKYAWAVFGLQFKRYLLNYIDKIFSGEYNSEALGRFIKTGELHDDKPVFEWQSQIHSGYIKTLLTVMGIYLNRRAGDQVRKLSTGEKLVLMEFGMMSVNAIIIFGLFSFIFDDEDEDKNKKTYMYRKMVSLRNSLVFMYNPVEMLKSADKVAVSNTLILEIFEATANLAMQKRYKTSNSYYGYKKGELKALREFGDKLIPFSGALREWDILFENSIGNPRELPKAERWETLEFGD